MASDSSAMAPVLDVVERQLGLRWSGARADAIGQDIRRAMAAAGADDPYVYARRLERDASALDALAEVLRVGETFFLREPGQLGAINRLVVPALTQDPQRHGRPLRVWSAGCASGEETYTLAILLEQAGLAGQAEVVGTDRSAAAIAAAWGGEYGPWALRAVDDALRDQWFVPAATDKRWSVAARLRRGVAFRRHDLLADPYPAGQDLVVCRNVLLYLTAAHGQAVVKRLAGALAPGGWLVLGSSDPHHDAGVLLESVRTATGPVYRQPGGSTNGEPMVEARRGAPAIRSRPHRAPRPAATPTGATRTAADALARCERDLTRRPLDADLHGLRALLLLEAGQAERAHRAATAALFLAPDLPGVHVLLGRADLALGDMVGAGRAFRNARPLLTAMAEDTPVPPSGTTAGRLLEVIDAAHARLAGRATT